MSAASAPDSVDRFWVRPRPDRAGLRFDVLLALVMLVLTTGSCILYYAIGMYPTRPPLWVIAAWILLMTAPLALRRLQPEAVTLVIGATFIVGAYQFVPEVLFSNIAMFIAMYSLGAWGRNRLRANVVRGIVVVGMFAWLFSALLQASGYFSLAGSTFERAPDDAWVPRPRRRRPHLHHHQPPLLRRRLVLRRPRVGVGARPLRPRDAHGRARDGA